ncbi:CLUMA_CG012183, isoform A [Clunio marinus]|uniref:CLUMA_CG012183, isoform A n=1 Tax=Clunio marinus TaxID=568069 RepID=A0A1J1IF43_9DIPT|nr:CLUMA_CG012183, isoform A [Clunio marinus]
MLISSRCKSGFLCFLPLLFIVLSSVNGQLVDEIATRKNGQENKVNSIRVNKIVSSDSIEQAGDNDRVALSKQYTSLNNKYVTQSAETSGPSVGLYIGSKKSK